MDVLSEYDEMRGGGVSSCAICDGTAFYGKDVKDIHKNKIDFNFQWYPFVPALEAPQD